LEAILDPTMAQATLSGKLRLKPNLYCTLYLKLTLLKKANQGTKYDGTTTSIVPSNNYCYITALVTQVRVSYFVFCVVDHPPFLADEPQLDLATISDLKSDEVIFNSQRFI